VRRTQIGESAPFIQKPFTPQEFYNKVREVLDARRGDKDHLEASD
jgi:hypothetical protein